MKRAVVFLCLSLAGCQCGPGTVTINPGRDGGSSGGGSTGGGSTGGGSGGSGGGATGGGATGGGGVDAGLDCVPPDVLIALDRTLTMHRMADGTTPADTVAGHALSKWSMAITAIEELTTAPLDQSVRFGLELWPREAPGCVTLAQRIGGTNGTNTACEGPEIPIQPALGTGAAISSLLDPETTKICFSTPTGDALLGAGAFLQTHRSADAGQFVVLVTDGADWDVSCPSPNPLGVVDGLRDSGIDTLVVGFSAEMSLQNGVGAAFLNDMACAGHTAKNFATTCAANDAGVYRALVTDGGALFYTATNASELVTTLRDFTRTVCCGCIN
ncbi:MAG: vWA domain-containing protein [Archangium sp.]